eukprot:3260050-Rhodomonas_salina.1
MFQHQASAGVKEVAHLWEVGGIISAISLHARRCLRCASGEGVFEREGRLRVALALCHEELLEEGRLSATLRADEDGAPLRILRWCGVA